MRYKIDLPSGESVYMELNDVATISNGDMIRLDDVRRPVEPEEKGGVAYLVNLTTNGVIKTTISMETPVVRDIRIILESLRGGMKQSELAKKAGIGMVTISRVENLQQDITTEKLERWLNVLGYTISVTKI